MPHVDLVLINPGQGHLIYQNLSSKLTAVEPPIWAGLIASYVMQKGFSAILLDSNAEQWDAETTAKHALALNPKLIAVVVYGHNPSASTQVMPAAGAICRAIKSLAQDANVLLVGGHVSALAQYTLETEAVNFVCDGEGPVTVFELLQIIRQNKKVFNSIPDLWFRNDQGIQPPSVRAPLLKDLDREIPGMPWGLLPMEKYRAHNWHCFDGSSRQPYAALYTTLGCPYRCEFCCIQSPFRQGEKAAGYSSQVSSYRFWSPNWVLSQIDLLVKNYGVKNIKLADEMFVLNRQHVMDICDQLIERDYGLNLWAYARVDTAKDPALLHKLKNAGFNWLVLGIEAASPQSRRDVDKNFKQEDIFESVRAINQAGIHILGNYIFGLPEDTFETMQSTLDLALQLNTEFANFYCAMAYPGSGLYARAVKEKWPVSSDWSTYSQHSKRTLPIATRTLTSYDIVKFRDKAFSTYFNAPDYQRMILKKFGQASLDEVQQMVSQTLEREMISQA